ncbi:Methylthioribose kinase [Pleomorphomonas sp. T1.2MG-36]|uniref:S-methyl-5-thioribose kinase n=1 Tax=Pleomorphomonas sp. T1.2MG-36 TaxID=3041167 RepID=UPI0024773BC1|nr:S-methyl-5-thioribose kinase [Pleomorphomonas sp. T1.2MG-36]CAI9412807.1 Methylthioribose kinase [Pleomorphomonas sp. T1.2MG-36]
MTDVRSARTGGADYRPMTESTLAPYLAGFNDVAVILGGTARDWKVSEVGDGNLNLVFIVRGLEGALIVKQALPYVRLVGDSWPLPLDRSFFESQALITEDAAAPGLVPKVILFDAMQALVVMEFLTPHIIMRKGLIDGVEFPRFAAALSEFMAQSLFKTSDLYLPAAEKKKQMAVFCANTELCRITEDLVFTDPYRAAKLNHWTSPQLDDIALEFRADGPLKAAAQAMKLKFLSHAEALVHGDLHSGSIMATSTDVRIIDPEFAFFGPMGFDVGALIGNMILAYLSQIGHEDEKGGRDAYRAWILKQTVDVWNMFSARFLELWSTESKGDAFTAELFADAESRAALAEEQARYMRALFEDTLGFAGCKMIRRILGLAHVADFESIADKDLRASGERRALRLGRELVVNRARFANIDAVAAAVVAADTTR